MVGAPAAADAVARARRLPGLKVGLHVVLVDGKPVLPAEHLPALTGGGGRGSFRNDMVGMGLRIFLDPAARRQLAREIEAQFDAYAATGLPLDHVDCHKHFHLHPTIARIIGVIGRRHGMTALRVPNEPADMVTKIDKQTPSLERRVAGWRAARLRTNVLREGLRTADRVFGLAWSGAMTEPRIASLIAQLPDGVTEIYTHPATSNAFAEAVPGYRYADELAALVSPRVVATAKRGDIRLAGYSDLI
jgi:chitin disaccharide deacetylase